MTARSELFDVMIYDMESRKIESIAGTNLVLAGRHYNAQRRLEIVFGRINLDRYSAAIVEAGKYQIGSGFP